MKHKRGEKTTKMKKDILKSDDAFLLEKDLQELEKLAHQKSKHIHIINELDEKIVLVQNSTRTLIPQLSPLHNYLRQKSPWYYKWHLKPFAKFVHWFALLLYLTALPFLIMHVVKPAPAVKASGYLFSRWQWSNPKIPTGRINQAVSCLDNESYWVAEDYGVILRSEDKGVKWDQEYTGAEGKDINGLVCISKTNIIAVGDSGLILQYSGLYGSWTERASNTSANITKVEYLGDNNLIALTDTTEVVTSSDSGATWSTSGANLTFTPVNITALSSTSAIVIGNGKIAATRDAGKSWVYPASQPSENFRSITKVNSETAIAVGPITGDHSHIIKITLTDTSFSSEEKQEVPAGIFMNSVSALNESNIIAVGSDNNSSFGKTYASLNGGDTWSELTTSEFLQPKQVIGLDANNAIVCGFLSCEKWTYNNGWSHTSTPVDFVMANNGYAHGLAKINSTYVLAFGINSLNTTANGGTSWTARHEGQDAYGVTKLTIPDPAKPEHIVGFNTRATIFISDNNGETWSHNLYSAQSWAGYTLFNNKGLMIAYEGDVWTTKSVGSSWVSNGKNIITYSKGMDLVGNIMSIPQTDVAYVTGIQGGSNPFYSKTTDGGDNWSALAYDFIPRDMDYLDGTGESVIAVIVTTAGVCYTTDKAATCTNLVSDSSLRKIKKIDINNAITVGDAGKIYKITRGTPWSYSNKTTGTANLNNIIVLDSSHILTYAQPVGSYIQTLLYSGDGGDNWSNVTAGLASKQINKIVQVNAGNLVVVGNSGAVLTSADYGATWTLQTSGTTSGLNDAISLSSTEIIAVGNDGATIYSSNSGADWTNPVSGTQEDLFTIVKADEHTAYAGGGNGAILKYYAPVNATATKLLVKLPGQSFADETLPNITGSPSSAIAGIATPISVYAVNNSTKLDRLNAYQVRLTSTDTAAYNSSSFNLNYDPVDPSKDCAGRTNNYCGIGIGNYTFHTARQFKVSAQDIGGSGLSSVESSYITVTAGSPHHLNFFQTSNANAGEAKEYIINLHDIYSNIATAESNIAISLSSTSGAGYFATSQTGEQSRTLDVTIPNGQQTVSFWYFDYVVGTPTIKAVATGLGEVTHVVDIKQGPVDPYSNVSLSKNPAIVGETVTLSTTPKDYSGNNYSGNVSVTSSRGNIDSISGGPNNFNLFSTVAGNATFRVIVDGIYLANAPTLTWLPGPLSSIGFNNYSLSQIAGQPFSITTFLADRFGNVKNDAQNKVGFSSSDSQATLPADYTYKFSDSGSHKFYNLVLRTAGDQKISAKDKNSDVSGETKPINVTPAPPSASGSYFKCDKKFIRPDGKDTATVSVFITDAYQNPYSDKNVTLTANRTEDKIETISSTTDTSGATKFSLTSIKQGTAELSATNITDNFVLSSTFKLRVSEPTLADILQSLSENPVAQELANKATPIATVALAIGLLPLLINLLSGIPFAAQYASYAFLWMLQTVGIKRRGRSWGIVFDSISGRPVDLAYVRLYDANTYKLAATQLTDMNGRFGFSVEPGNYVVSVTKKGYIFPTNPTTNKFLNTLWKNTSQMKDNWYVGQTVIVRSKESIINLSIPLDPATYKLTLTLRLRSMARALINWLIVIFGYIMIPLLSLGLLISALSMIILKTKFSIILTGLYLITLLFYIYRRYREIVRHGKVIDAKTQKPVAGAIIYVYDKKYNSLKTALITDKYGRFSVYVPEGDYYLKVMSKNRNLTIRQTTKKFFRNMYNAGVIHLDNPHFLNYSIVVE